MRRRFFSKIINKVPSIPSTIDINNYMTIEAMEDGVVVQFPSELNYSVDAVSNWSTLAANTPVTINSGQTISFKANLTPASSTGIGTFTITGGACRLLGNCMSLLYRDIANSNLDLAAYGFYRLFKNCTTIVSVSKNFLPATSIGQYAYGEMFSGCTSLTIAPNIVATTVGNYSCYYMFQNCTTLIDPPSKLPATTVGSRSYARMFYNCEAMTTAPTLPATNLGQYCYEYMFFNCKKLAAAPKLPATTLSAYCYRCMFYNCTALTAIPNLPATMMKSYCYRQMFRGCTSLTAVSFPDTKITGGPYCHCEMFHGCTNLVSVKCPNIDYLTTYCFQKMFYGCTKLNNITMLAIDISATSCLDNWVYKVASTGTFIKNASMTTLPTGVSGIPSGWTVQDA